MFDVMVAPTLPLLSDAPITAIDFGDRITDSTIINSHLRFCIIKLFSEISDLIVFSYPAFFQPDSLFLEPKQ